MWNLQSILPAADTLSLAMTSSATDTAPHQDHPVCTLMTGTKRFEIKTPDVVVHVDPERADLVETRIIDGRKCLVIPMEGEVELNGIRVHTGNENPSDDEFYDNTDTETEETSDGE